MPVEFTSPVQDTVKDIDAGDISFTYDTYVGPAGAIPLTAGGAWLSGGFFMNPGVKEKDGFKLMWVQTVTDNANSGGEPPVLWNLPVVNAGEFPDAAAANKKYAFQQAAAVAVPLANPTLGYSDAPSRPLRQNQNWDAELGLVCIKTTPDANGFYEARVVGAVHWGFNIANQPPAARGIEDVAADPPAAWGPATAGYLNTLNGFYDGCGGGGGTARLCSAPASSCGTPCTLNLDCDSPPGGGGDGVCMLGGPVHSGKFMFANNTNCFEEIPSCPGTSCDPSAGENPCTCPSDCPGTCPFCGDGFCNPNNDENACSCPDDCIGDCPGCGDGVCDAVEVCSCPFDCGECRFCGDGYCDPGEDASTCPLDCALDSEIPAVSTWGLLAMALATVIGGSIVTSRRKMATR